MAKIQDKEIRYWIKNNIRFDAKADGDNLYLRYRATDKNPVWFLRFKIAKIEQKVFLGAYPDTSLSSARLSAMAHRVEIKKGNNPAAQKRELKQETIKKAIADKSAQTVTQLVDEWFECNVAGKLKSAHAKRLSLNKYLIPAIGKLRIDAVEPMHISAMLNVIKKTAPTTSSDILAMSKQIFNYAIKRQIIKNNPAFAFDTSDAGGKETSRDRYLTHAELTLLFKAMRDCEKFTRHHYLCTKLLLLLGNRKSELLKSKREDFDLINRVWHISKLQTKKELKIDIPLSSSAYNIVIELMHNHIDDSLYLIPSMSRRKTKNGHACESYLNKPIKDWLFPLMDVENFTIHDFRATMKTHQRAKYMGVDRFVSERCLNHKIPDMEGVYDRGDYFEDRTEALQLWDDFLTTCEAGKDWNVTPIKASIQTTFRKAI